MPEEKKLSPRQKQILQYIRENIKKKRYPPSVREIGKAVGLNSPSTVHAHLEKLQEHGYIRKNPTQPRTIEVLEESAPYDTGQETVIDTDKVVQVPLVGHITAGEPILAQQNIEETLPLPSDFVKSSGEHFLLRVRGDSMIDAGIFSGDYAVIQRQQSAENGDIIAALIEDEATLKRFYQEEDRIRLQPENSGMEPIYSREVVILGKLVSLMRRY